jgi:3-demethoxyubiquinol 3-hydroxylase
MKQARGKRPPSPGVAKPSSADVEAMLRVDHAGEFGALCIYQGQLAVLSTDSDNARAIRKMAEQERSHFETFDTMIKDRAVRPTALEPVWRVAGFALGAVTAALGEKAALACTVAVEEVIDEHYAKQIERLGDTDPELKDTIAKFHRDECEHRDEAKRRGAEEAPFYPFLSDAIRLSCRVAIALSEKI